MRSKAACGKCNIIIIVIRKWGECKIKVLRASSPRQNARYSILSLYYKTGETGTFGFRNAN